MPPKSKARRAKAAGHQKENAPVVPDEVRLAVEQLDRDGQRCILASASPLISTVEMKGLASLLRRIAVEAKAADLLALADDMRQALRVVFQTKMLTLPKEASSRRNPGPS